MHCASSSAFGEEEAFLPFGGIRICRTDTHCFFDIVKEERKSTAVDGAMELDTEQMLPPFDTQNLADEKQQLSAKTSNLVADKQNSRKKWLRLGSGILVVAIALALYYFDPARYELAPKCFVKWATGYSCPGCGLQRAAHAAFHGHFSEALHYNFFFLFSLPYLALVILSDWILHGESKRKLQRLTHNPNWLRLYIVLFFAWWILRNIFGI